MRRENDGTRKIFRRVGIEPLAQADRSSQKMCGNGRQRVTRKLRAVQSEFDEEIAVGFEFGSGAIRR